eukprot:TRINITY_DN7012_c1_g1_i2.p1 TRINITY_DN7012_c1_g1~~TRINITY_DN7012_c1_g1_i2.p1  ORF type:complete len:165 (-),score=8.50 TRINITY_DN7012_c1_g1_i2:73-534(-)
MVQVVSSDSGASYKRIQCIGKGSFGFVYKGVKENSGEDVAIKVLDMEEIKEDIESLYKEVQALKDCHSEYITQFHDAFVPPQTHQLHIIMELMACSVQDIGTVNCKLFISFHLPKRTLMIAMYYLIFMIVRKFIIVNQIRKRIYIQKVEQVDK